VNAAAIHGTIHSTVPGCLEDFPVSNQPGAAGRLRWTWRPQQRTASMLASEVAQASRRGGNLTLMHCWSSYVGRFEGAKCAWHNGALLQALRMEFSKHDQLKLQN
jgi:hypothetical protein